MPYTHAVRLQEALKKADVPNELLTIPGGKHGGFTPEERTTPDKTFAGHLISSVPYSCLTAP